MPMAIQPREAQAGRQTENPKGGGPEKRASDGCEGGEAGGGERGMGMSGSEGRFKRAGGPLRRWPTGGGRDGAARTGSGLQGVCYMERSLSPVS